MVAPPVIHYLKMPAMAPKEMRSGTGGEGGGVWVIHSAECNPKRATSQNISYRKLSYSLVIFIDDFHETTKFRSGNK